MDGTLLNNNGLITENTVNAIRSLVKSGVIFTISTGRPIQGVEKCNCLLCLRGPVITYNGAMIVDAESHETLFERGLGSNQLRLTVIEEVLDIGVTKILWYDDEDTVKKMIREISGDLFSEVTYCTSKPTFLEFFNRKVSKSEAMRQIGHIYNSFPEEMIAIGDGLNDLSMIQYAGLGIAMANADREVKENAQYITTSNDDEGILNAIKRFFPGEFGIISL